MITLRNVMIVAALAVSAMGCSESGTDIRALPDGEEAEERSSTTTEAEERVITTTTRKPPTTTTTAAPETGTRTNPDPLGVTYEVSSDGMDGKEVWTAKIDTVNFDAWPAIQAENQFNSAPAEGWRFVMIQLTMGYETGEKSSHPGYVADITATGSANRIYDAYSAMPNGESGCGVFPGPLSHGDDLLPGGTATGNVCLPIPDAEIVDGSLRLLIEPTLSFDFDSDPIWITPFA